MREVLGALAFLLCACLMAGPVLSDAFLARRAGRSEAGSMAVASVWMVAVVLTLVGLGLRLAVGGAA